MNTSNNLPVLYTVPKWNLVRGEGRTLEYYIPQLDRWVNRGAFTRVLSKIGITTQEYYDRWILNITVPSDRPKCLAGCGRYKKFAKVSFGYYPSCSDERCVSYLKSENGKIAQNDPKVIEKRVATLKITNKLPEVSKRRSDSAKECQSTPEARERNRRSAKNYHESLKSDHEKAKLHNNSISEGRIRSFRENPQTRINHIAGQNKPETRLRRSNSEKLARMTHKDTLEKTLLNGRRGKKSKMFSRDDGEDVYFDSTWEKRFLSERGQWDDAVSIRRKLDFYIPWYTPEEEKLIESGIEVVPHNYSPDFIMEMTNGEIWVVEIKPLIEMDKEDVQAKIKYAIPYCKSHGYRYVIFNDDLSTPHFYC